MTAPSPAPQLLATMAEPSRLRILNCLAAAPLFVSDLQAVLGLPQSTVSRHLQVLRREGLVRDTPIPPYVIYRLERGRGIPERLLRAVLSACEDDEALERERREAGTRSRAHTLLRLQETADDAEGTELATS